MKIENNGVNPLASKPANSAHPVEKNNRATESTSSAGSKDKAILSARARELSKARAALDEAPDVRSDKVQELKQQVDTGKYEINFEELARKLLNKLCLK